MFVSILLVDIAGIACTVGSGTGLRVSNVQRHWLNRAAG